MRCSALRPCNPNASRSPRTRRIAPSGATRPSALPRGRVQDEAGVYGQLRGGVEADPAVLVELVDLLGADVELGHAGPAGVDGELGAVLLGVQPHR